MGLLNSQGKQNEDLAKNMLKLGLDIEQISEITGLSKEEIEKLDFSGRRRLV